MYSTSLDYRESLDNVATAVTLSFLVLTLFKTMNFNYRGIYFIITASSIQIIKENPNRNG